MTDSDDKPRDKADWWKELRVYLIQGLCILVGLALGAFAVVLIKEKYGLTDRDIYDYKAYVAMVICAGIFVSWTRKKWKSFKK